MKYLVVVLWFLLVNCQRGEHRGFKKGESWLTGFSNGLNFYFNLVFPSKQSNYFFQSWNICSAPQMKVQTGTCSSQCSFEDYNQWNEFNFLPQVKFDSQK